MLGLKRVTVCMHSIQLLVLNRIPLFIYLGIRDADHVAPSVRKS
jgi:hypothetical protein